MSLKHPYKTTNLPNHQLLAFDGRRFLVRRDNEGFVLYCWQISLGH